MTTTNTAGRGLAIAAGVILASGTLAILFEDVLMHGAAFTLKHWLTLVTVAGTMLVGHLADLARRHRHWASVAGFTLLFLAGTGLVVYSSVGRQAEKTLISSAEHDDLVAKRVDLRNQLASERETLKDRQDAADRECASGVGPKCKGAQATVAVYADSVAGLEARLAQIATPKPVDAEAEQFAATAAALGFNKDKVRALAILLAPFFKTLFLEFGTIASFGFAFSPKRHARKLSATQATMLDDISETDLTELRQQFAAPIELPINPDNSGNRYLPRPDKGNGRGNGGGGCRVYSKTEAEADLVTRLALGETVSSQDGLANRWGVNKATVSKWLKEWEHRKLIPARQQIGRQKRLMATV